MAWKLRVYLCVSQRKGDAGSSIPSQRACLDPADDQGAAEEVAQVRSPTSPTALFPSCAAHATLRFVNVQSCC